MPSCLLLGLQQGGTVLLPVAAAPLVLHLPPPPPAVPQLQPAAVHLQRLPLRLEALLLLRLQPHHPQRLRPQLPQPTPTPPPPLHPPLPAAPTYPQTVSTPASSSRTLASVEMPSCSLLMHLWEATALLPVVVALLHHPQLLRSLPLLPQLLAPLRVSQSSSHLQQH